MYAFPFRFAVLPLLLGAMLIVPGRLHAGEQEPVEEAAVAEPVTVPNLMSGRWAGSWHSFADNHQGPMRATFFQLDAHRYEVRFRGRFWKIFPFRYTVVLTVTGWDDERVYLNGQHRLGPLWGTYSFNGWATQTQFVANFCSRKDRGQFVLSRQCR
jgi:hypothetical protein